MITKNDRNTLTQIVKAFCSAVEAAGYWVGIYSSESFFNSEMNDGGAYPLQPLGCKMG